MATETPRHEVVGRSAGDLAPDWYHLPGIEHQGMVNPRTRRAYCPCGWSADCSSVEWAEREAADHEAHPEAAFYD